MDAATLLLLSAVFYLTVRKRIGVYIAFATTPAAPSTPTPSATASTATQNVPVGP